MTPPEGIVLAVAIPALFFLSSRIVAATRGPRSASLWEAHRRELLLKQARTLQIAYSPFAHYEDDSFVRNYARCHEAALLAARDEIIRDYLKFHEDPAVAAAVNAESWGTYRRATWKIRALALAEQHAVTPSKRAKSLTVENKAREEMLALPAPVDAATAPRRTETEDEWEARKIRHAERTITQTGNIKIARTAAMLRMEEKMADLLKNLDPDKQQRLLAEFRAALEAKSEDSNANETYEQY